MRKVLILILLVLSSSISYAGSIISLSITASPFAIPCCAFNFDPVPVGGSASGQFAIKNVSTIKPIAYAVSVNSPFKVGATGIAPATSIGSTLAPGASVTVSVLLNNAPAGFLGKSALKIQGALLGTTENIPNWFVAAHVVPKQADLTVAITGFNAVVAQGSKRQVTMSIAVTNKGFDGGLAPQIEIAIDGKVEDKFQFVSVNPSRTETQSNIQFLTSASGPNHTIKVTVDSTNVVPEFNETNNTAQITKDFP